MKIKEMGAGARPSDSTKMSEAYLRRGLYIADFHESFPAQSRAIETGHSADY
jgi:hypothetical protein